MRYGRQLTLASLLAFLGSTSALGATLEGGVDATASSGVADASASSESVSTPNTSSANDWEVAFTPYLWVAGTKGDISIPRLEGEGVEIDRSFADVLANLKFAFMGALDVRYGRFIAVADVMYLSVGAEVESIENPQFLTGETDSSVFLGTAVVGYRIVDKGPLFVDLFAGARVTALDVKVVLTGPLQTREREASPTNISPLIGGRVRVPLGKHLGLAVYGDVGSIFGSSDVKWQIIGTVQYDLGRHWRIAAGYRHMSINHSTPDLDFDVALSGPILGVTYRF